MSVFKVLLKLEINSTRDHMTMAFIKNLNSVLKTMPELHYFEPQMFVFLPQSHNGDTSSDYLTNK